MSFTVKLMEASDSRLWDEYVNAHPKAVVYHLSGWKNVIQKTYGHRTYYLMALKDNPTNPTNSSNPTNPTNPMNPSSPTNSIAGILPLVHLKHFFFGNSLISLPFFDLGGILADKAEVEAILLKKAISLSRTLKVNHIELRQLEPLFLTTNPTNPNNPYQLSANSFPIALSPNYQLSANSFPINSHKVRMLFKLPDPCEDLMKTFRSKLRSQIMKPIKEGLLAEIGGIELLEDFYKIFLIHMRDLGSPVHSKKLIQNTIEEFHDKAKIMVVYKNNQPMAGSLVMGFKNTLENPWASALKKYSALSPNMFLYWNMLNYAHVHGFSYFNFGRSSSGESTFKFKEQWGARPMPLYWYRLSSKDKALDEAIIEKDKFQKAIAYWKKLPVPVTKILGPLIRKHIGL